VRRVAIADKKQVLGRQNRIAEVFTAG